MNQQLLKNSESGRTMLEMLGVLGIMGIIMYGAIAGINYGMSTYKVNQTYNEVQEAIQGIKDLYSWSRCYGSASGEDLSRKMRPNDIFTNYNDDGPENPFGGNIEVRSAGGSSGCADTFFITYKSVDEASCNRLREMDWGDIVMDVDSSCSGDIVFCPKNTPDQTRCN